MQQHSGRHRDRSGAMKGLESLEATVADDKRSIADMSRCRSVACGMQWRRRGMRGMRGMRSMECAGLQERQMCRFHHYYMMVAMMGPYDET